MVKSPIRVFVRTRPVANSFSKNLNINDKEASINLNIPRNEARGHINHLPENWNFKFDGILANSSQETVFDTVARETIQSALEGFSGTIFCYGQTGAGKTFTMSGSTSSYQQRGIIPRTISALFQEIAARPNEQFEVKVSYLEIYNEIMIDLLGESQEGGITINESGKGGIVLKGLNQIPCKKEEESLNLLFEGEYNKSMANHKLNQNSSRSHSIFTLYIQSKCKMGSTKKITSSKINLVDLAGSERTKKTGSGGQTLIEANYINKSLSFLEQVVIALCEKQRDHVPYRQSKLTYLLKDSLGGNCKTVMIANIWPEASNLEETISTLKFATRIRNVSNEATANVWLDAASPQKKYELQQSLCFSDLLSNEPLTFQEQREQQKIAREFLNGRINDIEVKSHPQVKELFHQFRNMYRELYDATKDFFHLIPSDKLKKLGIKLDNLNSTDKTITLMADQSQRQEINEDFEDLLGNALRGNLSPKKELRLRIEPQISLNSLKSSINEGYMSKIRSQTGSISVRSKEDEGEFEDKEFEKKFFRRVAQTIRERSRSRGTDEKQKRKIETAEFKFPNNEKEEEFHLETEEEMHAEININEIKQRAKVRAEVLNNIKSKNFLHGLDDRRTKSLATEYTEEFPLTEHPLLSPKASLGANQNRNIKVGLNPQAAEGKAQSLLQKQQIKPDHRNKV